jgi:DNA repair exonuclease SbcCD nuclease subunit
MKICLLGDTHFGVRNDSKIFHAYIDKFYNDLFFPYLEANNITHVIQLGDLFDRRKYINFLSLTESRRYFFDRLEERGITLITLLGNHDIFWRERLDINSPDLLLKDYQNITLVDSPQTQNIHGFKFDMIPWICKENEKEAFEFIKNSEQKICFGHFELRGFEMMKGIENHDGMDPSILSKYDQVYSGHFHTKSNEGNIMYLGTPYELFWNDYKDPKGFFILDTETNQVEFIQNNDPMFIKYYYDDMQPINIDAKGIKDKYIKLVVVNKKDFKLFDKTVEMLYNHNPAELKIIEDMSDFEAEVDDENINVEDTMSLLSDYVDAVDTDADKDRLKTILKELYVEAHDYAEEK